LERFVLKTHWMTSFLLNIWLESWPSNTLRSLRNNTEYLTALLNPNSIMHYLGGFVNTHAQTYKLLRARSIAVVVFSISRSLCAKETKAASNWEGGQ